eukprot:Protomagalhaensia_sp_Gyna_25__5808@NODE_857_length_2507_cov_158_233793_g677_i0_p1_GENE_NODE_857_length_2507_cov_158_233793_g677_i0NODE_857_length_2507_cov_158_233793_g677_i0_p1_ORF_typecomplete_len627_score55_96His_Phos_2/PF00328_22/3_8e30_NODE_857_length_2507_cov_158_233793_g677_i02962176
MKLREGSDHGIEKDENRHPVTFFSMKLWWVVTVAAAATPLWTFPSYCLKVDKQLPPLRSIPPLSSDARALTAALVQVQAVVRHGARVPASKYNCWSNYAPQWDCILDQVVQGRMPRIQVPSSSKTHEELAHEDQSDGSFVFRDRPYISPERIGSNGGLFGPASWIGKLFKSRQERQRPEAVLDEAEDLISLGRTGFFEKVYDAEPQSNVLGGTCQKGQLLAEGLQQHQLLGHLLARAYQTTQGEGRVLPHSSSPLVDLAHYDSQIYFRASDMQRTVLSGSALLTAFLKTSTELSSLLRPIPIHTMDLEREHIFPNLGICPGLRDVREEIFASRGYAELRSKYADLEKKISLAIGREDISDVWPGEFFDCVMTAVCTGQFNQLPAGLRPEIMITKEQSSGVVEEISLLNYTFEAVDEYATFEYTWSNAVFSKTAMAAFYVEVKSELLRALLMDLTSQVPVESVIGLAANITDTEQYAAFFDRIDSQIRMGEADSSNPWDGKRLVLYAGHDTSVMPFLAALGGTVFDGKWPPYASEVIIELYRGVGSSDYFFRLIYNGEVLTSAIPACSPQNDGASDLCRLSSFFTATSWATPRGVQELCVGTGVSSPAPATERWLLRRRYPVNQVTS